MAFSFSIQDNAYLAGTQGGALLHAELNQALAAWSQYIAGVGTLSVGLSAGLLGTLATGYYDIIAEGGPTSTTDTGMTVNGATVVQPAAAAKLQTGASTSATDISITYNALLIPTLGSSSDPVVTLEHELLHGFGVSGFRDAATGQFSGTESTFDALTQINATGAYFVGQDATRIYGGPVPLTVQVPGSNYYHVGATGTSADPTILYNDLISPYRHTGQAIDALDVALLADLGIPLTLAGYDLITPPTLYAHSTSPDGAAVLDPTISGTTQAGRVVTLSENGAVLGTTIADPNGNWSIVPPGLADGFHDLIASVQYNGAPVQYGVGIVLADGAAVQAIYNQLVGRNADPATLANLRQMLAAGTTLAALHAMVAYGVDASVAIGQLYAATLGRWVDDPGLAAALNFMAAGGTFDQVRAHVAASPEAATAIAGLYAGDLGRPASSMDVVGWQAQLAAGSTLGTLRSQLASSGEAAAAIASLYPAAVGRVASAGEIVNWQSLLAQGGTLAGVRVQLADSVESEIGIGRIYAAVLGRWVDQLGLDYWVHRIENGAPQAMVRSGIAVAVEAATAVSKLYVAEVGRPATAADMAGWQSNLANGSSLGALRTQLASSGEAAAAISFHYNALVGRAPTTAELVAGQDSFRTGGGLATLDGSLIGGGASSGQVGAIDAVFALAHVAAPQAVELAADESELASGVSLGTVEGQIAQLAGGPAAGQDVTASIQVTPETIGNSLVYGLFDNIALLRQSPERVQLIFAGGPATGLDSFDPETDVFQVHASEFSNYDALRAHVIDVTPPAPPQSPPSSYVEFGAPDGAYVQIYGIHASQLTANNFQFV